jgi:hypothetical protein
MICGMVDDDVIAVKRKGGVGNQALYADNINTCLCNFKI